MPRHYIIIKSILLKSKCPKNCGFVLKLRIRNAYPTSTTGTHHLTTFSRFWCCERSITQHRHTMGSGQDTVTPGICYISTVTPWNLGQAPSHHGLWDKHRHTMDGRQDTVTPWSLYKTPSHQGFVTSVPSHHGLWDKHRHTMVSVQDTVTPGICYISTAHHITTTP